MKALILIILAAMLVTGCMMVYKSAMDVRADPRVGLNVNIEKHTGDGYVKTHTNGKY